MIQFDLTYGELKNDLSKARKGMIIIDTASDKLNRYIVKDVINGSPLLIQVGDKYSTTLPNWIGDYMLNLRTGYISIIDHNEYLSFPLEKRVADPELSDLRKEVLGY